MRYLVPYIAMVLFAVSCRETAPELPSGKLTVARAMGTTPASDFEKVVMVKEFMFPADHGPHPGFQTEWWYFTGNLSAPGGKDFGYQFTIFRTATGQTPDNSVSAWTADQIYMAHFAVSDPSAGKFYFSERFSRGANLLAGATAAPLRIWLENWEIIQSGDIVKHHLPALKIRADNDSYALELRLTSAKPLVLQGEKGLSRKGRESGNASYYYSYTRLPTEGELRLGDDTYSVHGYSWLDREWSTSALDSGQVGWDWFALQLDDTTEIMYYQLRKHDGSPDSLSSGSLVLPNGSSYKLNRQDVILKVLEHWDSPGGSRYPSGWNLQLPDKNIDLVISPLMKNQLMDVTVTYWEGAVRVEGKRDDKKLTGKGYVELTGY